MNSLRIGMRTSPDSPGLPGPPARTFTWADHSFRDQVLAPRSRSTVKGDDVVIAYKSSGLVTADQLHGPIRWGGEGGGGRYRVGHPSPASAVLEAHAAIRPRGFALLLPKPTPPPISKTQLSL